MQIKLIRMKKMISKYRIILLAIAILFSINEIKAQCEIQIDKPMPVCYQDTVIMAVNLSNNYRFIWTLNNDTLYDGQFNNIPEIITANNSLYKLDVYDFNGSLYCHGEKTITMRPTFDIDFEQLELTCWDKNSENGNRAKVRATASGEGYSTFTYHWDNVPEIQQSDNNRVASWLGAYTNYMVTVTNEYGCKQTDTVRLKAYMNPRIEFVSDPKDTVFLDNPYVKWSFNNLDTVCDGHDTVISIYNHVWEFEGFDQTFTEDSPTIAYSDTGNDHAVTKLYVTTTSSDGYTCDTTYTDTHLWILPVQLKIPNIFTPNGDGINDYFEIGYGDDGKPINDLSVYFLSNKLTVFNRWGRIVYESNDYKNDWDGGKLPDGTYFYVLECKGKTNNYRYKGAVMIWNSGR